MGRAKILLIDDDVTITEVVKEVLELEGYEVMSKHNGKEALSFVSTYLPDVILVDYTLPDIDGFEICRHLKSNPLTSAIPVIMVTGRSGENESVTALELGADDYIVKPFSAKVLVARVRVSLRRLRQPMTTSNDVVTIHSIKIDRKRFHVVVEDNEVKLTITEYKILECFALKPGWVFTRGQLINALNGNHNAVTDRSIDVQIVGLRKKLGQAGSLIETLRGIGYRLKDSAA